MGKDVLGIQRGECIDCGKAECEEFLQDYTSDVTCGYCSCPPVRHVNESGSFLARIKPRNTGKKAVKDIKGIQRGHCKDCGETECPYFMLDSQGGMKCGYCKCAPVRHIRVEMELEDVQSFQGAYVIVMQQCENYFLFQIVKELYVQGIKAAKIMKDLFKFFVKMGRIYIATRASESRELELLQ